jgi:rSAM/selenodomain-associated transferase 1
VSAAGAGAPALLVIAKEPLPGKAKTRLSPPLSPVGAAALAEAALADTLAAVAATPARRRVVVLDGRPGMWLPDGFEVLPQRGGGLDERLGAAFADVGEGALLVGMDTPQVTPDLLQRGLRALATPGTDAVLGLATDGGYWAIGLRRPDPRAFLGVPMSRADTGAAQRARLAELGLVVRELPVLRDVDTIADATAVAALAPGTRFAAAVALAAREAA